MQKESVNLRSKQSPSQEKGIILEFPSQESSKQDQLGQPHIDATAFGMAGEEIVRYLLHMWNYPMFLPLNPASPFDLVIKNGEEWITIQIKHSRSTSVSLTREGKSNGVRVKRGYKKGDFDYLFSCKFPYIYIVPWKDLKSHTCFSFSKYESYRYDLTNSLTYINKPILTKEENERTIN